MIAITDLTNGEVFKKLFGLDIKEFMTKYSPSTINEWVDMPLEVVIDETEWDEVIEEDFYDDFDKNTKRNAG